MPLGSAERRKTSELKPPSGGQGQTKVNCDAEKSEGADRLSALFSKVAEMPRPKETFGENDQTGRENAEADPRRSVTQAVAGTYEQDERQIAKPSESYERPDHQ
jgi:hypothetical protein